MFALQKKMRVGILACLGVVFSPLQSMSQTPCASPQIGTFPSCVTSNLNRVLLLSGGESGDHDPATANNVKHLEHLDSLNSIPVDYYNVAQNASTALSTTTLAKYNVMIWFNVYETAGFINATYQNNIKQWFEAGHGLGCYHQCVKVETAPGIWPWYDSLMGQPYTGYAAVNVTGPVYVDSQGVQSGFTATQYSGQSFTWSDEWYDYQASPRGMPGVKIILTTKDGAFTGTFNSNTAMKADHVLSWTHDIAGGRYFLNGGFHPTINQQGTPVGTGVQTNMQAAGIAFVDAQFLAAEKYLAGYTGCKDTSYWEYSSQATNQGTSSCVTLHSQPKPTSIVVDNALNGFTIGKFSVSIHSSGKHSVELFDMKGRLLLSYHGVGPQEYNFSQIRTPGIYYVRVKTPNLKNPLSRQLFLL